MSVEPSHQQLWDAWQSASDAFESCACDRCQGKQMYPDCQRWQAYEKAKRAYVKAKEDEL